MIGNSLFFLAFVLTFSTSQAVLALVASSPYRMILYPTNEPLNFSAVQVVKDAISASLLVTQPNVYAHVEIVVQQVEFYNVTTSTGVGFFALAATADNSTQNKGDVDNLIEATFANDIGKTKFLNLLSSNNNTQLSRVQQVAVAAIQPAPVPTTASPAPKQKLSVLDIVLISVSFAIFVGIVYMVLQYHWDRGYVESQRTYALNAASHADAAQDENGRVTPEKDDADEERGEAEPPHTPSTTHSAGDVELCVAAPETPRSTTQPTTLSNSDSGVSCTTPLATLLAASSDAGSTSNEDFQSIWFQSPTNSDCTTTCSTSSVAPKLSPSKRDTRSASQGEDDVDTQAGDIFARSDSSESVDVFGVDVDAAAQMKEAQSNTSGTAHSNSSPVAQTANTSELINAVQPVVPLNNAESSATNGSTFPESHTNNDDDDEPILDHSSLEQSSLEQVSLEDSMASSSVGAGDNENLIFEDVAEERQEV
jgi:hypothetical protein